MKVIYYDMLDVKDEIRSFVNIERYGDLHYKKMTLEEYSKKIFQENELKTFYRIKSKEDIHAVIDKINYSDTEDFIFLSSNLAIVNKEAFSIFLKKIQYIRNSLAICGPECIKPLMKLSGKEALSFLKLLTTEDQNLYKLLEQKSEEVEKFSQESFYHEIKSYNDFVAYLQTNFELRYFNSIQSTRNVLTKKSEQKEKMRKEYTYYSVLPDEMRIYFLPPFNFKEHKEYAEYSMERLNVLDVSVQWIHYSLSKEEFRRLMRRLFDFIHIRKTENVSGDKLDSVSENLYLGKLEERLKNFRNTDVFKTVNDIISDSTAYASLDEIIAKYKRLYGIITKLKVYKKASVISHGDLCFSNILYDKRIDFIKLIDPKGCLTEQDAYMDGYYDLAKLSHSVLGNYDFINSGIFEIRYDNQMQVHLEIPHLDRMTEQKELFRGLLREHGFPYEVVRLFEASLFLSMLPLHIDYPKKVLAYILTAIQILEELEEKYVKPKN